MKILVTATILFFSSWRFAQESSLLTHYPSDDNDRHKVTDRSGSGPNANLNNNAYIISQGNFKGLNLDNDNGYLDN